MENVNEIYELYKILDENGFVPSDENVIALAENIESGNADFMFIDDVSLCEGMNEDYFYMQLLDKNGYVVNDRNLEIIKEGVESGKYLILESNATTTNQQHKPTSTSNNANKPQPKPTSTTKTQTTQAPTSGAQPETSSAPAKSGTDSKIVKGAAVAGVGVATGKVAKKAYNLVKSGGAGKTQVIGTAGGAAAAGAALAAKKIADHVKQKKAQAAAGQNP